MLLFVLSLCQYCRREQHRRPAKHMMRPIQAAQDAFKLQILSDIHLEFGRKGFDFPQTGNALALVGDIGDPASAVYESFLLEQAARFDKVFVLAGNHEFYHHSTEECIHLIQQVCSKKPTKLIFLNQTTHDMGEDYVVLGCTLWSEVLDYELADVSLYMADFRHIQGWTVWRNNHQHSIEGLASKRAEESGSNGEVSHCVDAPCSFILQDICTTAQGQ